MCRHWRTRWSPLTAGHPTNRVSPFQTKKIAAILARGFDVIHYHNISLVGGPRVLTLGNALKLYSAHEYWLDCPMNVLFCYDGVACSEYIQVHLKRYSELIETLWEKKYKALDV